MIHSTVRGDNSYIAFPNTNDVLRGILALHRIYYIRTSDIDIENQFMLVL